MSDDGRTRLDACVDAIESGYEYCLAYAAQGRRTDLDAGASTSEVRRHLENMAAAMDELDAVVRDCAAARDAASADTGAPFLAAVAADAAVAASAMRLTLAKPAISSQLIDNLNASIHVRAMLTDLFIVDELFR